MPQLGPVVAGILASAVVRQIIVTIALTLLQKALQKKPQRGAFAANVTVRSTIAERHLILGTSRATGAVLFYGTGDTTPNFLWFVVAYASHQCSALKDCWLDKIKIPAADINGSTGAVSTASFGGKLKIWDHLGTQAQTVDTNIDASFAAWTTNHKLRGICYRVFRLERDADAWPTGAPQMLTSLVDGALLYDPRLDSTNGGSGTHRADNPSTWAFSHNWALATRWFLSGGSVVNDQSTRMIKFGVQETDARIDDAYTIAAANIADQSLSGANATPAGAEARYTVDIEVSCGQTRRDILEELLMCGGPGQLVYVHGKWRIYAGAYDAPVHTFTQDDIFGELQIDDTTGDEDRFNVCSGVHIDAAKDYGEATSASRTNAAYVTQDGGQTIPREIQIRGVTSTYRAQRITERILRDGRQMRTVKFPFGRQGMKVAPWETFSFSHDRYGWSGRVFRCIERDVQRNDEGGIVVMITAKASAASVDTDLVTADYTTGTSATNSLQSEPPDAPTALTATSLLHAIQFTWTITEFWKLNGIVELWEGASGSAFGSASKIWEGSGLSTVIPKTSDFTTRDYWVRVRTIGAQTSSNYPSGSGVSAVALPSDDVTSDPTFVLDTSNSYWWRYDPGGGTSAAIAITGGRTGGLATFVANGVGVNNWLVSRRKLNFEFIDRQRFTIRIRCRKTGSFDGSIAAQVWCHDEDVSSSSFTPGVLGFGYGEVGLLAASISTSWTEIYCLAQCNLTSNAPYISLAIGQSGATTGTLEVDHAELVDGFINNWPEFEYTAAKNLDATHIFTKVFYNAAGAANIRLPAAGSSIVGAQLVIGQRGAGLATLTVIGGNQMLSYPHGTTTSRPLAGQNAEVTVECVSSNTWKVIGQLA